jgi:hypothetical protein
VILGEFSFLKLTYSSANDHIDEREKPLIKLSFCKNIKGGEQWQEYLKEGDFEMIKSYELI